MSDDKYTIGSEYKRIPDSFDEAVRLGRLLKQPTIEDLCPWFDEVAKWGRLIRQPSVEETREI